ncbi:MAG: hypothetical protein IKX77_01125 [Clostridia bacterium]|nr:hypothetical protein [Clostridia bacterium]
MKNTNDSKSKIKKQILSGAVYIALAVTVFAFTVNTITSSFAKNVEKSFKRSQNRLPVPKQRLFDRRKTERLFKNPVGLRNIRL